MRWLYGISSTAIALAILAAAHFSNLNAADPAYAAAAQPVICVSGCVASGGTVVVNQGTSPWVVSDQSVFAAAPSSSITRPANTTTYTANTGWCNATSACATVFTFTGACRANGTNILVTGVDVYSSANPTLKLTGYLWLFNTTPGTVISDDATFNIASADFANLIGGSFSGITISLSSNQASGASNSGTSNTGTTLQTACASGSTTLYGMFEVGDAYVPASAEVLTIKLHTIGLN